MTKEEVKYETDKAEKYLKEKYPDDEFAVGNITAEVWQNFRYPIYTINCIDKTRSIKFYISDREKQLREPLMDSLEFCIKNKKKESNKNEEIEEIKNEIYKYFNIDNKNNLTDVIPHDLNGGDVSVDIMVTGKEIPPNDFKTKTDKIISYLKMYKDIRFMARGLYTDSSGVKRYHERSYYTYKGTITDKIQYALKEK